MCFHTLNQTTVTVCGFKVEQFHNILSLPNVYVKHKTEVSNKPKHETEVSNKPKLETEVSNKP